MRGAGVDRRQDEQRLEHDGEVIPILDHAFRSIASPATRRWRREDLRHADRERYRAARAAAQRFAADLLLDIGQVIGRWRPSCRAFRHTWECARSILIAQ